MDRQSEADTGGVDEVARQRQKRNAARRDQHVGGTPTGPATVESVIRYLGLDRTPEPAQDETAEPLALASRGQQRLRTVAQLEALLLKE